MKTNVAVYTNDYINLSELSGLGLFNGVNLTSIEGLLNTCPLFELEAGDVLISPDQKTQVLYLLVSGRLRVYKDASKDETVATIAAGECAGELAVMDQKPCTVLVVAEERCRLLAVDEDRLLEFINGSHGVARNFLLILMNYLRYKNANAAERDRLNKKYKRLSSVDDLTGLHNRRWLDDILTRQIMRSSTDNKPLTVIMLNVDRFGEFRNEFGRNPADQALYTVAQILMKNARPTDLLARFEEEKFCVALPDTDIKGAEILATRLRKAISETKIVVPNECILPPVTASQGIAQLKAFISAERLLLNAVSAVERASAKGGNLISA